MLEFLAGALALYLFVALLAARHLVIEGGLTGTRARLSALAASLCWIVMFLAIDPPCDGLGEDDDIWNSGV